MHIYENSHFEAKEVLVPSADGLTTRLHFVGPYGVISLQYPGLDSYVLAGVLRKIEGDLPVAVAEIVDSTPVGDESKGNEEGEASDSDEGLATDTQGEENPSEPPADEPTGSDEVNEAPASETVTKPRNTKKK
jgi:hypothetical protein